MSSEAGQEKKNWLKNYFREISKIPLLKPEEEFELARQIRTGDQAAFEKLIKSNLRFVVKIAQKYKNQGLPIEDLVNEGNLGLIEAAKRFDETRGFKFISYAVWWIRQAIKKALTEQSRMVRIPLNRISEISKIAQTFLQLEQQYKRRPSAQEVANALNLPVEKLSRLLMATQFTVSLEAPPTEDDSQTLIETIRDTSEAAPDVDLETNSLYQKLKEVLDTLTPEQAAIIKFSFGIDCDRPLSSEEIAKKLNLTHTKVRLIRDQALKRLKHTKRSHVLRQLFRS